MKETPKDAMMNFQKRIFVAIQQMAMDLKSSPLYFLIIYLFSINAVVAQDHDPIVIGNKYTIQSDTLAEKREYWVSLPESYQVASKSYQRYPLLILLDGPTHFKSASGIIQFMSSGNTQKNDIPEMIVVGVSNVDRRRDFTPDKVVTRRKNTSGGGNTFLHFLEHELIPEIDRSFRTKSFRTLVGHSLGGLLTTHAYLQENTIFNAFVSIDPSFGTWDEPTMDGKIEKVTEKSFKRPLYLATANWEERNDRNKDRHELFMKKLTSKSNGELDTKIEYFENKNHHTVPLPALYHGLTFIFDGYNYSFRQANSRAEFVQHYQQFSDHLSFEFLPPEVLTNRIGYRFLRSNKEEEKKMALDFFLLNSQNYPNSSNAFDSLGEAQMIMGNKEEALKSFLKSLALNPQNTNAQSMIEQLKNE